MAQLPGRISSNETEASLDRQQATAALSSCVCLRFRTVSRAVTQLYDQKLAPAGLRSTQLVVLLAIAAHEPVSPSALADELVMDRTTLARNTRPLEKAGLVEQSTASHDRRRRLLALTDDGHAAIARAAPLWQQAQAEFIESVGEDNWAALSGQLSQAMQAMRQT